MERITRAVALFVVSALLAALAAGGALATEKSLIQCKHGTAGNDSIVGTNYSECILAFGGNDYVDALGGNDTVNPGPGDDTVLGYYGNDVIDGSFVYDNWQRDDQGNDDLYGVSGDDTIIDWVGYDWAFGGYGNDTIDVRGGSYADYVDAGPGYDTVYANSNDTVVNAEQVYKSAAGAKSSSVDQERPEPPKLSKAETKSTADAKSPAEKDAKQPKERTPTK
jgi:Ca2+-binding RTX toxin-like protein